MLGRATALALLAARRRGDRAAAPTAAASTCREVLGDIADRAAVRRAVAGQDAVVHLAAKVDVVGPWAEYERANVGGTRAVSRPCRRPACRRLVHVSSPVGGARRRGRWSAPAPARPIPRRARGHYARSKAIAERARAGGRRPPGLAVLAVRPHLVWGPGDTQLVAPDRRARRGRAAAADRVGRGAHRHHVRRQRGRRAAWRRCDRCGEVHGEALVVSNGEPRPVAEILRRVCRAAGVPGPRGRVPFPVADAPARWSKRRGSCPRRRDTPPLNRFLADHLATAHWFDQRRTRAALAMAAPGSAWTRASPGSPRISPLRAERYCRLRRRGGGAPTVASWAQAATT